MALSTVEHWDLFLQWSSKLALSWNLLWVETAVAASCPPPCNRAFGRALLKGSRERHCTSATMHTRGSCLLGQNGKLQTLNQNENRERERERPPRAKKHTKKATFLRKKWMSFYLSNLHSLRLEIKTAQLRQPQRANCSECHNQGCSELYSELYSELFRSVQRKPLERRLSMPIPPGRTGAVEQDY